MADRRGSGLTFGQLITLTFGFLLASVVIFVFGLWVGRDLAEQRAAKEREVPRVAVAPPEPAPVELAAAVTATAAPPRAAATPTALAAAPTATAVAVVRAATPTAARALPPTARAERGEARGWTVQANATNDTVRAVMLARRLRGKGYDAYTVTEEIRGATWYLVRVGRFRDRASAKAMESKLRAEEGLEAAYVTAQ